MALECLSARWAEPVERFVEYDERRAAVQTPFDPVKEVEQHGDDVLRTEREQMVHFEDLEVAVAETIIVGVEQTAHRAGKRRAPLVALRVVDQIDRADPLLAPAVALLRVRSEVRVLDQGGRCDDLEHAGAGRRRLDAEVARRLPVDVARVDEQPPGRHVHQHHGRLRKVVRGHQTERQTLQLRVERQPRGALLRRSQRPAIVRTDPRKVEPRERGRGRALDGLVLVGDPLDVRKGRGRVVGRARSERQRPRMPRKAGGC